MSHTPSLRYKRPLRPCTLFRQCLLQIHNEVGFVLVVLHWKETIPGKKMHVETAGNHHEVLLRDLAISDCVHLGM